MFFTNIFIDPSQPGDQELNWIDSYSIYYILMNEISLAYH
jgi:hypothetical protein